LLEQGVEVEAAVRRRVGSQPADRLLELPHRPDAPAAAGLVPRDRDVDQALEEVALGLRRVAPGQLQLLVRGEVLAGPDELDPLQEAARRFRREGGRALLVRPINPGHWAEVETESFPALDS